MTSSVSHVTDRNSIRVSFIESDGSETENQEKNIESIGIIRNNSESRDHNQENTVDEYARGLHRNR